MIARPPKAAASKLRPVGDNFVLRSEAFQPYVQQLAELLHSAAAMGLSHDQKRIAAALDGQPGRELRKSYLIASLRNTGTYFTGSRLATRLISCLDLQTIDSRQIVDPACGAGDLLVACARLLPMQGTLSETLNEWGKRLAGFDINSAFVEAARYRLALLALERSGSTRQAEFDEPLAEFFPNIRCGCGMEDWNLLVEPSLVVINPPFSYMQAAKDCQWGSGRVSQAATFLESCLRNAAAKARVLAILPDVLRTGTRYERWRLMVEEKARVHSVEIAGRFDELTEVSIFLLHLEVGDGDKNRRVDWAHPSSRAGRTVKDVFDVRVGPVVPFRLEPEGPWRAYAHSENLPAWKTVRGLDQRIRFKGTTYKPPFVSIRRTSKVDYQIRCIGTIVTGEQATAVENHLLVALPRDGKVSTCKILLDLLKRDSTSSWMNERIRCRHLTVGSVEDLPWPEDL
jgi:hypothetical protein